MPIRQPAVAGQFYPADPRELASNIEDCFTHKLGPGKTPPAPQAPGPLVGIVSPHAGYMYSGPVAAHAYYASSARTDLTTFIILGPNHWGTGSGVATYKEGSWRTPLGEVEIDQEAAKELAETSGLVDFDEMAHRNEHSIEVQVPFLQHVFTKRFKILPVSMALQDRVTAVELGQAVAAVTAKRKAFLIASSDFTHYQDHKTASRKDAELVKAIEKLDVNQYYTTLERLDVSACGYGPIAAVMTASKILGAKQGRLLKYATSGDTTGDYSSVVGYASIAFT